MGLGAIFGVGASVSGMYMGYYWNVPSGPSIVLVVFGMFLLALLSCQHNNLLRFQSLLAKYLNQIARTAPIELG